MSNGARKRGASIYSFGLQRAFIPQQTNLMARLKVRPYSILISCGMLQQGR